MGLFRTKHIAILFDDKGEYVDDVSFKRNEDVFTYGKGKDNRKYNIVLDNCTIFERHGYLRNKRYYFYNINNPMPFILNKKTEPYFNSKLYNIMLETKVARDLNNLVKGVWSELFTARNVIIAIIIIGVIVYFTTGGKITGAGQTPTP